jgi:NTE family protein
VPALLASTAIPGVFPPVTIGRRTLVDGGIANHTPVAAAIELGASRIYVLPVGYPWLNQEPTNALGMALHALARFVEQKLDAEVESNRSLADIHVLPALDLPPVSPADFSRTKELIEKGYTSALRYLRAAPAGTNVEMPREVTEAAKALKLDPSPARAA